MPKLSICVPNWNYRPFLPERFDSIFEQTFKDWEVVICDCYSTDGAWEYLSQLPGKDSRIRAYQVTREGIYPTWNQCLQRATGDYVYIATSDDTMSSDCLEKLMAALESHPECDLAHCPLLAVGDNSDEMNAWWRRDSPFALSSGEWMGRPHVRLAPLDGLLHLYGVSVYVSITQLMIRRSLFDKIGQFNGRWGSVGDFHWNMKASLVANTVHVPDAWGGWRLHSAQATRSVDRDSWEHRQKIEAMIDDAIDSVRAILPMKTRAMLRGPQRHYFLKQHEFRKKIERLPAGFSRLFFVLNDMMHGSPAAKRFLLRRLQGLPAWDESPAETVTQWLNSIGITESIIPA